MGQIKFYQDANQVWVYTDGISDSEQTVNSPCRRVVNGTKIGIFSSLSNYSLFREPNELVEVTDIQKSATPGDNYADVNEFIAATVDFFVNASGGGGISGTVSLNTIPIGAAGNTLIDSEIIYNPTLDRYESSKEFYATKLSSQPGTLELGNLDISSGNHEIVAENLATGQKAIAIVQRYDNTGTSQPEALQFGAVGPVDRQLLFNENQPSVPYSYSFTFGPTERVWWTGLVVRPEEEGTFIFTMRANDANGPIITTQNDFVFTAGDVGNETTVPLSNDFELIPNETVHITLEGAKILGGTPLTEWLPYFKAIEADVERVNITTSQTYAEESISTSLISGGEVTENTPTAVDIAEGVGRIVSINQTTGKATAQTISFGPIIGAAIPDITTNIATVIAIDENGDYTPLPVEATTTTIRNYIILGLVTHATGVITGTVNDSLKAQELYSQFIDCLETHGTERKSGLAVSPNADLTFAKTAGELQSAGAGIGSGNRGQNRVAINAEDPATFDTILGLTNDLVDTGITAIDPLNYDNGTGSPVAIGVPSAQATIQYLYQTIKEPAGLLVMYGQTIYDNLSEAQLNAPYDVVIIPDVVTNNANLIGRIALRSDCTDLSDPDQAVILEGVKFGVGLDGLGLGNVSGGGDMFGGTSSVVNQIPIHADTSGKILKDGSGVTASNGTVASITGVDMYVENIRFPKGGDTFTMPNVAGSDGDPLETDGGGNLRLSAPVFDIITTSQALGKADKLQYVDASANDITLTLEANPRNGEHKRIWLGDTTNRIELVSASPSSPVQPPAKIGAGNIEAEWALSNDFVDRFNAHNLTNNGTGGAFVPIVANGKTVDGFDFAGTAWLEADVDNYKGISGATARSVTMKYQANAGAPTGQECLIAWGEDIPPGGLYWEIEFRGDDTTPHLWVNNRNASRRYDYTSLNAVNLFDGNLHDIAVVQSGNTMSYTNLFIDGVKVNHYFQDTFPANTTTDIVNLTIGTDYLRVNNLNAVLYDIRLFNRALSISEIDQIRNQDLAGGAVLSGLTEGSVLDVTYNGSQWDISDAVSLELLELDSRIENIENDFAARPTVVFRTQQLDGLDMLGSFSYINTSQPLFYDINGVATTPPFTSGRLTIEYDGSYQINVRGYATKPTGSTGDTIVFYVSVNGGDYLANPNDGIVTTSFDGSAFDLSGILKLNVGDTVQIAYTIESGAGWDLNFHSWDLVRVGL